MTSIDSVPRTPNAAIENARPVSVFGNGMLSPDLRPKPQRLPFCLGERTTRRAVVDKVASE